MPAPRPIVLACAGCSSAAELSWILAKELDRRGIAEMSCLAGVAAGKKPFLDKLKGRPVWLIDGCPIECALGVFGLAGLKVDRHIRLADLGVRKNDSRQAAGDLDGLIRRILQTTDEP